MGRSKVRGGCGLRYGVSIDFRLESLAGSWCCRKTQLLMRIDLSINALPPMASS
jgi:hypothetical protein